MFSRLMALNKQTANGYDCGISSVLAIQFILKTINSNESVDVKLTEKLSFENQNLVIKRENMACILNSSIILSNNDLSELVLNEINKISANKSGIIH